MRNRMLCLLHVPIVLLLLLCMNSTFHCFAVSENSNNITKTTCIEIERKALLVFKQSLVDRYNRLSSWGSQEDKKDCCKWSGIYCSKRNHHVIMLNLSAPYSSKYHNYSTLRGNINNPSLLQLHNLRYLDLSYNDFGFTPIPNFLGSFRKLKFLDLSHARFGGTIPSQLGNLSKLEYLDLGFNSFNVNTVQNINWMSSLSSLTHLSLGNLESSVPNSISFTNLCNLTYLDLSSNTLNGTLSSLLKDLACSEASMQSLILTNNTLTGSINGDDITRFPSLWKLNLDKNRLNGFMPNEIGQISNLQHLDLSYNSLRGVISESHFLNLTKLKYLDLSGNTFALELSPQWVFPFQLDTINLADSLLGPRFPKWLKNQTKISHLNLSNSGISDSIPTWFWNQSTHLQFLDLSCNKLRGMLPDLSSKFVGYHPLIDLRSNYFVGPVPPLPSSLAILNLSQNKFSGRLSFLCSINGSVLNFLDLSDNLFSGGFPGCFEYFHNLIVLNIAHNRMSGKIPNYASSSFFRLETLALHNNSFFGVLPALTFRNSKFLNFVDLSVNKLSGNIPAWIGENLPRLRGLSLRSNKFTGSIPQQLCHLKELQILDLSLNSFSGSIPRCFNNFTAMSERSSDSWIHRASSPYVNYIHIDSLFVMWKGGLLQFTKDIVYLSTIDLSSNKITGQLPEEITNLKELRSLNVSSNKLCGVIPAKIGLMHGIEAIDFSRNKFSGEIPLSMEGLNALGFLNVSYNVLSGRIPTGDHYHLVSFKNSSFEGNSGLCGMPLTRECTIGGGSVLSPNVCMITILWILGLL